MFDAKQLCKKITDLYPDIGSCGIDVDVTRDHTENTWIVHLKKDHHSLKHFLESQEANLCMDDKQCVALGLEISQLKKNVEGKQF